MALHHPIADSRIPARELWVVAGVTLALAAIEPLLHVSFLLFTHGGAVPSFIHTGDSAHHLCAMRSWSSGFYSPYATAASPWGAKALGFYMVPFFLLYGLLGGLLSFFGLDNFLGLGLINGAALALLLVAAYRLLVAMAPRHALRAWLLFALGGGIGGVAWLLALAGVPWVSNSDVLYRLGLYELLDVQALWPHALAARLYYTLPIALGFFALARCVRGGTGWTAVWLFAGAAFINPRLGPMLWLVAALRPVSTSSLPWRWIRVPTVGLGMGFLAGVVVLRMHPNYAMNVAGIAHDVARPVALAAATLPVWLAVLPRLWHTIRAGGVPAAWGEGVSSPMVRFVRASLHPPYLVGALLGYLGLYGALYAGYQVYYGGFILGGGPYGGDAAAAVFASDRALLGLVPGWLLARWLAHPSGDGEQGANAWPALWLLVFLMLSLGAFLQGWALRFAPERFLVLLGLPLALLAAQGLDVWRPALRRAFMAAVIALGVLSVAAWGYINGPWPGTFRDGGIFPHVRYGLMTTKDADMLHALPPGRVAVLSAPELRVADMAAVVPGISALHAVGTMNISDRLYAETAELEEVLSRATDEKDMARVVREESVDFILLSDTAPPQQVDALRARLAALSWLEPVEPFTDSLFRVVPERLPPPDQAGG